MGVLSILFGSEVFLFISLNEKSVNLVVVMAWAPWAYPNMQRPNFVNGPLMDPWTLLRQRDAQIQNLQTCLGTKDRQIAAMTKNQQAFTGKKGQKKRMEEVLKEKDFFLKRCQEIENRMTENDVKIASLTQENNKLKNEKKREIALDEKLISDLKKRCHNYESENTELKRKNEKLETRVSQLEGDVKSLRASLWLGNDTYSGPLISRLEAEVNDTNAMFV